MTGETPAQDPALLDIDRIYDMGARGFLNTIGDPEEARFRMRRAYDRSWQEIWEHSFGLEEGMDPAAEPATIILNAFNRIWAMRDNPAEKRFAQFAMMCHWSKGESNEFPLVFDEDASYYYQSLFTVSLQALCEQGNFKTITTKDKTMVTSDFLVNYIGSVFLNDMIDPNFSNEEAQLGVRNAIYGPGPTEFS